MFLELLESVVCSPADCSRGSLDAIGCNLGTLIVQLKHELFEFAVMAGWTDPAHLKAIARALVKDSGVIQV